MDDIMITFLQVQSQMRILHWQTETYSQHMAFGDFYDAADDLIDKIIEAIQGKYGRIKIKGDTTSIDVANYGKLDIDAFIADFYAFITDGIYRLGISREADTEIDNMLQELIGVVDRLKYLLTLK